MTIVIILYIIMAIVTLLFLSYLKINYHTTTLDNIENAFLSLVWPFVIVACLLMFIGFTAERLVRYFMNKGNKQ